MQISLGKVLCAVFFFWRSKEGKSIEKSAAVFNQRVGGWWDVLDGCKRSPGRN